MSEDSSDSETDFNLNADVVADCCRSLSTSHAGNHTVEKLPSEQLSECYLARRLQERLEREIKYVICKNHATVNCNHFETNAVRLMSGSSAAISCEQIQPQAISKDHQVNTVRDAVSSSDTDSDDGDQMSNFSAAAVSFEDITRTNLAQANYRFEDKERNSTDLPILKPNSFLALDSATYSRPKYRTRNLSVDADSFKRNKRKRKHCDNE